MTAKEYKGLPAPDDGTYTKIDRDGVIHELPVGVDYGWDYAPGASVKSQMGGFVANKAASLPEPLSAAFLADVAQVGQAEALTFEPQATAKACGKWAVDNGLVDAADYTNIDAAVTNAMNESLFLHMRDYPALRDNQKFIGTGQAQFTRWHVATKNKYVNELVAKGYDLKTAKHYAGKYIKKPRINGNTFMHSWSQPEFSGIAVNEKWGLAPGGFVDALEFTVKSGYHPVGCNTIKSVADHEFGHQLDDLLGLHSNSAMQALYNDALQQGIKVSVSGYAGENIKEFIAECWAEALNSPNPRLFSTQVARLVKDEYARQFPTRS